MSLKQIVELLQTMLKFLQQINALRGRRKPERQARPPAPPPAPEPAEGARPRRRSPLFGRSGAALLGGLAAGGVAYFLVKRRQRIRARNIPIRAPFAEELLEVLAAPGGGRRLSYTGEGLLDPDTGAFYPVVDGIPHFGGGRGRTGRLEPDALGSLASEFYDLLVNRLFGQVGWGGNLAGTAALAGAVAHAADGGWCLSVPSGTGMYEIEMARANPQARILCLDPSWDRLLEARLRALEAGLSNLYFVSGEAELLPLRTGAFHSAWTANGFHFYPHPEQAMVELTRIARPGALIAGMSLVPGGPRLSDALLRLRASRLPGLRDLTTHLSLLAASGLRDLRAVRDGAVVRFGGTRA